MDIDKLCKEAYKSIDTGEVEKALKIVRNIEGVEFNATYKAYFLSVLYIDIGYSLNEEEMINKGINVLEMNLSKLVESKQIKQSVYYNLGNGYNAIFNLKIKLDPYHGFIKNDIESHKALKFYNQSLKSENAESEILVETFVNMGNLLDSTGRNVEAIEYYDRALSINPEFGIALANKGLALKYYARLTGYNWINHYKHSYDLIKKGLKNKVYKDAEGIFLNNIKEMESYVDFKNYQNICNYEELKITSKSDLEEFYKKFCIKYKLYLNLCNYCKKM